MNFFSFCEKSEIQIILKHNHDYTLTSDFKCMNAICCIVQNDLNLTNNDIFLLFASPCTFSSSQHILIANCWIIQIKYGVIVVGVVLFFFFGFFFYFCIIICIYWPSANWLCTYTLYLELTCSTDVALKKMIDSIAYIYSTLWTHTHSTQPHSVHD